MVISASATATYDVVLMDGIRGEISSSMRISVYCCRCEDLPDTSVVSGFKLSP